MYKKIIKFIPGLFPEEIRAIQKHLPDGEFFLVGGLVRDSVLTVLEKKSDMVESLSGNDWDIATSIHPECIILPNFKVIPTGIEHGTVTVVRGNFKAEITTYRFDMECDGRHAKIAYANTIEEDLSRRDFTINAMAVNLKTHELVDYFGGCEDILSKTIRTVGDSDTRFREDGLRLMRGARFAAHINGKPDRNCEEAMRRNASLIDGISAERIQSEIMKIMETENPGVAIGILRNTGILKRILPELDSCFGIKQNQWHSDDVGVHSVLAMEEVSSKHPLLRFTALLHDIGKPGKKQYLEDRKDYVFYDHQNLGAELAEKIFRRLKFSNEQTEFAVNIIKEHMFAVNEDMGKKPVRRMLQKLGSGNLRDLIRLRIADRAGNRNKPRTLEPGLYRYIRMIKEIERDRDALNVSDLVINGDDLKKKGLNPGPIFKEIFDYLVDLVIDDPARNNREFLINEIDKFLNKIEK